MADDLIQFDGGFLVADLLSDASVDDSTELTRYAIEDGSLISDHVIRQPRTMSLTLVQTQTPIVETTGFARALQALSYPVRPEATQTNTVPIRQSEFRPAPLLALGAAVRGLLFGGPATELKITGQKADQPAASKDLKVHVLSSGSPLERINDFHGQLLALLESASPVIVTVKGNSYVDLVVVGVKRTDAAGQVGKANFAVELQQIATVETQTVDLPPVPKSKAPKQAGPKPAEAAKLTTTEKATVALQLLQGGGAFTGPR